VRIASLVVSVATVTIAEDLADLALGKVDIAIGTHRLLSRDIHFKNLGLLIIDEEHRFGVRHKERLRKLQSNVDTLYMSATPIPRTMNMALAKLKEISLMQTSPKERLPIRTIITLREDEVIREAIQREIDRGGQVFFIHNRIQTIETVAEQLKELMPGVKFAVTHAQMPEKQLEDIMGAFINREYQVLISTTIIENGIDIPNANTIIIDRADTFGLAQLYQMRGRVGRSNRRAYAYL
jgi:transcription-repair coupling factor (superfamily II helicase)